MFLSPYEYTSHRATTKLRRGVSSEEEQYTSQGLANNFHRRQHVKHTKICLGRPPNIHTLNLEEAKTYDKFIKVKWKK